MMNTNFSNGVLGNSIDIHVDRDESTSEIRADIKVDEFNTKRIWGQVLNCAGQPIPNSLVKLVRVICKGNRKYYEGIAHTITDCEGFYQFDVCENTDNECYKIIINKAVTGPEKIINTNGGNCNSCCIDDGSGNCVGDGYNPCRRYQPIIKDYNSDECNCNNTCNNTCGNYSNNGDSCNYANYASYTR